MLREAHLFQLQLLLGPVHVEERFDFGEEAPPRPLLDGAELDDVALDALHGQVLQLQTTRKQSICDLALK